MGCHDSGCIFSPDFQPNSNKAKCTKGERRWLQIMICLIWSLSCHQYQKNGFQNPQSGNSCVLLANFFILALQACTRHCCVLQHYKSFSTVAMRAILSAIQLVTVRAAAASYVQIIFLALCICQCSFVSISTPGCLLTSAEGQGSEASSITSGAAICSLSRFPTRKCFST